jgi:hypothetical protein
MAAPTDGRCLRCLQEVQRQVLHDARTIVDDVGPLRAGESIDACTPCFYKQCMETLVMLNRYALHQEIQVERAASLKLDGNGPTDARPAAPQHSPQVSQFRGRLRSCQVFASREDCVERRRILHCVKQQHLARLDREERRAVGAEIRRATSAGRQFAGGVVEQAKVFRPAFAALRGVKCSNSLMQVKGFAFRRCRCELSRGSGAGSACLVPPI